MTRKGSHVMLTCAAAMLAALSATSTTISAQQVTEARIKELIKQAADAAKSLDPKKVADVLHSGRKFKTVIGDISYDKKGDVTRIDYVVYVWKKDPNGKINLADLTLRNDVSKERMEKRASILQKVNDAMPDIEKAVAANAIRRAPFPRNSRRFIYNQANR